MVASMAVVKDAAATDPDPRPSKGPWILVGIVLLIQLVVWTVFIWFAEQTKPEPVLLEQRNVENHGS